ncbi:MAG: beta-propeller fold lactonase family protein [Verrucomicrobia bacterium]|nr:beta-propeller fold lactonase family protein [Verrucomicrobiota bacterium]
MIRYFCLGAVLAALLTGCSSTKEETASSSTGTGPTGRPPTPSFDAPGPQADGRVLLPNQWFLSPVGKQVLLGDFPVNVAVHPTGKFAAVLHAGYGQHEITVVELASNHLVCRAALEETFYGLAFSQDGKRLFCSGAGSEVIHSFSFKDGYLGEQQSLALRGARQRGVPAGLALAGSGKSLFAANLFSHSITECDLVTSTVAREIRLGTNDTTSPAPSLAPAGDEDEAAITKRAEAILESAQATDPFPYACVLDEKRGRLYVSLWAQAQVAALDVKSGAILARWATEEHPNEMLLSRNGKYLFVANANRNTVTVLATETGQAVETLLAELIPNAPPGNTPNGLALSPDETMLFVANANINCLAVFDVATPGKSRSLGFVPTGWYPTSVRVTPDGKKLLVANGKGLISKSNRNGPRPGGEAPASVREYIAGLMQGTLSVIDIPSRERFEEQLKKYTAQAYRCLPRAAQASTSGSPVAGATNASLPAPPPASPWNNPIPRQLGAASPIKYVIYMVKENRTYDQVLGDMKEGHGDASLCLFPERVTPNHHKLAREFVLLDNFYVASEVSADGHEWSLGAYASDFVEKLWPLSYGHNKHKKYTYPAEGNFALATPAGGYLWDRAREAGVSYRSYGEFVQNGRTTNAPATAKVSGLKDHFDPWFHSFDVNYSDLRRADRFISELRRFEQAGEMPRLQIVRLPNDHTAGAVVGKLTPTAYLAENDLAFGRVVEAVTRSKFWAQTAIFVVEDDAQNGSDHIDAHRTIAYVISPYVKRGLVDSTLYSTCSMLRSIELILGLRPMSQFDAVALPMFNSFQSRPELKTYTAEAARVSLNERITKTAWGTDLSAKMNFAREDAADDLLLNEIIWRSVKGPDQPMPAPVRAAFVFSIKQDKDD